MKIKLNKEQIEEILANPEKAEAAGIQVNDPWWVIVGYFIPHWFAPRRCSHLKLRRAFHLSRFTPFQVSSFKFQVSSFRFQVSPTWNLKLLSS